jgi:hypothetical protein
MSNSTKSKRSEPEDKPEKSGPAFSRKVWTGSGWVEVAVFPKTIAGENGDYVVWSTLVKRAWKEGDEYKSGSFFRPEDLLPLALFLQEAASFVMHEASQK